MKNLLSGLFVAVAVTAVALSAQAAKADARCRTGETYVTESSAYRGHPKFCPDGGSCRILPDRLAVQLISLDPEGRPVNGVQPYSARILVQSGPSAQPVRDQFGAIVACTLVRGGAETGYLVYSMNEDDDHLNIRALPLNCEI